MPQVRKTFSLDEQTLRLLDLIMSDRNVTNQSEVLRSIIGEEAVRSGIVESFENINIPTNNLSHHQKPDIIDKLDRIEALVLKLGYRESDIESMTYQIRDGVNSYLTFLEAGESAYASADPETDPNSVNCCMTKAKENYEIKKRRLAVSKTNFKGRG